MSRLEDLITEFAKSCFGEIHVDKDEAFKQQIKALFNELIPEKVNTDNYSYEDSAQDFMLGYVQACIEMREKIGDL